MLVESKHVDPDKYTYLAFNTENLVLLEWFVNHGATITHQDAGWAAKEGRLSLLQWMYRHNIIPKEKSICRTAGYGRLSVLQWLVSQGVNPSQEWANCAVEGAQVGVLKFLATKGVLPDRSSIQRVGGVFSEERYTELEEWLVQHGLYERK